MYQSHQVSRKIFKCLQQENFKRHHPKITNHPVLQQFDKTEKLSDNSRINGRYYLIIISLIFT